jgi:putative ABC transport system substrate-binding protein
MSGKILFYLLTTASLITVPSGHAQQAKKVPRIGYLTVPSASAQAPRLEAFRQGLRELGYVEGKNIFIEYRFAEGNLGRVSMLAGELVNLKVDVIVSAGLIPTRSAKKLTDTIPIVMTQDDDPVGNGFVNSLGQPGGNVTGLSTLAPEISAKQLEVLKEFIPKLSRVAVVGALTLSGNALALKGMENTAGLLNLKVKALEVRSFNELERVIEVAKGDRSQAINFLPSTNFLAERSKITALMGENQLPAIYCDRLFVEAGGLMSYGPSHTDLYRRASVYVDKILKGAKPGDLPVEQPEKFEFVINLKTAKQINLAIPQWTLMKADRVMK